jgi:hypothetical protein
MVAPCLPTIPHSKIFCSIQRAQGALIGFAP